MKKKTRQSTDYPQFTFRISAEKKQELSEKIDEVTNLYNNQVEEGEYLKRKNNIIIEALEKGLEIMKKNISKK